MTLSPTTSIPVTDTVGAWSCEPLFSSPLFSPPALFPPPVPFPPEALSPAPFALPNHELMLLPVFPICPETWFPKPISPPPMTTTANITMMYSTVSPPNSRRVRWRYLDAVGNIWRFMIGLQWQKWLNRSRFYRIEFCLLAVGKTKKDLLVVLLNHLIINEKESEGLWWSTATRVNSDFIRRRS